jgi:hypothetical protein
MGEVWGEIKEMGLFCILVDREQREDEPNRLMTLELERY